MENILKKQKRYLMKWTLIAGIICGVISGIVLLITGAGTLNEAAFWMKTAIMASGGGYICGFLPAVLVEYRRSSMTKE